MIRFKSFSSGSCGNCSFLGSDEGGRLRGVLIDAGVSWRSVLRAFSVDGLSPENVGAILVTHDHYDHIRHLGSLRAVSTVRTLKRENGQPSAKGSKSAASQSRTTLRRLSATPSVSKDAYS